MIGYYYSTIDRISDGTTIAHLLCLLFSFNDLKLSSL